LGLASHAKVLGDWSEAGRVLELKIAGAPLVPHNIINLLAEFVGHFAAQSRNFVLTHSPGGTGFQDLIGLANASFDELEQCAFAFSSRPDSLRKSFVSRSACWCSTTARDSGASGPATTRSSEFFEAATTAGILGHFRRALRPRPRVVERGEHRVLLGHHGSGDSRVILDQSSLVARTNSFFAGDSDCLTRKRHRAYASVLWRKGSRIGLGPGPPHHSRRCHSEDYQ
jgi:hypothetical protein